MGRLLLQLRCCFVGVGGVPFVPVTAACPDLDAGGVWDPSDSRGSCPTFCFAMGVCVGFTNRGVGQRKERGGFQVAATESGRVGRKM